jgi:hypothetical protein
VISGWEPWTNDRYPPRSFVPFLYYQGRANVIGVEISHNDGLSTRPSAYQYSFYNTQGKSHAAGGARVISSSLYIPAAWGDPTQGNRRTDLWLEMNPVNSDYPIIGFTNYGGSGRYRVWNETGGVWIDLPTPVVYDAWTDFRIEFTGTAYKFYINNVLVQTEASSAGITTVLDVKLEAYNFTGDVSLAGAVGGDPKGDYVAYWTNPIPEVTPRSDCGCADRRQKLYAAFNAVVDLLINGVDVNS